MGDGMKVQGAVAFVTGGNRGLGRAFAEVLLARGAAKVYVGAREPGAVDIQGVTPVPLDVTSTESVMNAARQCEDTTLLVNNAGIVRPTEGSLDPKFDDVSREIFETNYYGVIRASQAFVPVIQGNGGGGIVNVLSDATWFTPHPALAAYAVSKSAARSYTNALRNDLGENGTQVVALHVGFLDTDMTRGVDVRKSDPRVVAGITLDGLTNGMDEVLGDEGVRIVKGSLSAERSHYLVSPDLG